MNPNRPEAGNMQMTNEQITELAEPFWLKDAQKEGEFFDANGFARALLSASKPASPSPAQTERGAFERDVKQLADWLLTDPQTGGKLRFSGPLEREFLGMSRVKMETKSGEAWTLTAGLKEGYLTATQRMANLNRIASEERESTREPSQDQLKEMAYLLELVPRGEVVCVQFLEVLRKQYRAAMEASGV